MEPLQFALLGLGVGAMYALLAHGLVLVYRSSGVLNFSHAAVGMVGAYACYEVRDEAGWPMWAAVALGVVLPGVLNAAIYLLVMRPLRTSSPLTQLIATLALLLVFRQLIVQRYEEFVRIVESPLPHGRVQLADELAVGADRLWLAAIALVVTAALFWVYRTTRLGLATTAVSENELFLSAYGWSPHRVSLLNWVVAGFLGGGALVLIAPLAGLSPHLSLLIIPALGAVLVGGLRSFSLTLVGALAIGMSESLASRYIEQPGWAQTIPFLAIVGALTLRGNAIPTRGELALHLPAIGPGRVPLRFAAVAAAATAALVWFVFPVAWVDGAGRTFAVAIVLLSLVVVAGYAGQLSLAQYTIGGAGAWIASRLVVAYDVPFEIAFVIGVLGVVPLGILVALPAVRVRGVTLAVATLGLSLVLERQLLLNPDRTGGIRGTRVPSPQIFGIDVGSVAHPERYALVALVALVVCATAVANLRRGATGRELIAVRANERAASALGIDVARAKLYAFGVSAALAAVGCILLAFRSERVVFGEFGVLQSLYAVVEVVIGGLGFVAGTLVGGFVTEGGLFASTFGGSDTFDRWLRLLGGVSVLVILLRHPDGFVGGVAKEAAHLRAKLRRAPSPVPEEESRLSERDPSSGTEKMPPRVLEVRGVTVRYGGVTAVADVSLTMQPGTVAGLIGPNGAGKTSFIDAVTGFTSLAAGTVRIDDRDVSTLRASDRARLGIGRSFQSLELFEDLTVEENIRVACERRSARRRLTDLARPIVDPLTSSAVAAIDEFGLGAYLHRRPSDLSAGHRRLVGIARAVAAEPSVLLLDEPAAGLDDTETAELGHLIRRLARQWGMAILLVEHDVQLVFGVCDRVAVLDFGRCIAEGPPDEIRADTAVIAAYLGSASPPPAVAGHEAARS